MYGKAVQIRHCPATVIAESFGIIATGISGKAATARRRESQETDQIPIFGLIPASMGEPDSFMVLSLHRFQADTFIPNLRPGWHDLDSWVRFVRSEEHTSE